LRITQVVSLAVKRDKIESKVLAADLVATEQSALSVKHFVGDRQMPRLRLVAAHAAGGKPGPAEKPVTNARAPAPRSRLTNRTFLLIRSSML
jgi:hypothetical protein